MCCRTFTHHLRCGHANIQHQQCNDSSPFTSLSCGNFQAEMSFTSTLCNGEYCAESPEGRLIEDGKSNMGRLVVELDDLNQTIREEEHKASVSQEMLKYSHTTGQLQQEREMLYQSQLLHGLGKLRSEKTALLKRVQEAVASFTVARKESQECVAAQEHLSFNIGSKTFTPQSVFAHQAPGDIAGPQWGKPAPFEIDEVGSNMSRPPVSRTRVSLMHGPDAHYESPGKPHPMPGSSQSDAYQFLENTPGYQFFPDSNWPSMKTGPLYSYAIDPSYSKTRKHFTPPVPKSRTHGRRNNNKPDTSGLTSQRSKSTRAMKNGTTKSKEPVEHDLTPSSIRRSGRLSVKQKITYMESSEEEGDANLVRVGKLQRKSQQAQSNKRQRATMKDEYEYSSYEGKDLKGEDVYADADSEDWALEEEEGYDFDIPQASWAKTQAPARRQTKSTRASRLRTFRGSQTEPHARVTQTLPTALDISRNDAGPSASLGRRAAYWGGQAENRGVAETAIMRQIPGPPPGPIRTHAFPLVPNIKMQLPTPEMATFYDADSAMSLAARENSLVSSVGVQRGAPENFEIGLAEGVVWPGPQTHASQPMLQIMSATGNPSLVNEGPMVSVLDTYDPELEWLTRAMQESMEGTPTMPMWGLGGFAPGD